ncbi:Nucleoside-diphosphate-sugar epimerase [Geosmithia morbida]|uniref:Nucleoside-diphosphate-sugar epimerase n=1 Tax=Geosmithia morbida TaxID=1094350 RepID=A0A9P5D0U3_9HYPO|nr:Nucleoside-diphosphate-sugar epimerase [Geosmithia morbida]KAF4122012.1 Nucleoside-diphosphate-sugar epimerase [Geosmithia morbida]
MSSPIKNVALAGAGGDVGSVVLEHLRASGKFNLLVLRRTGSGSTFPSDVKVADVDFSSVEALTAALEGQDALVSTVGTAGLAGQTLLVDAAAAAGVKRFLPSEFGSNLDNPNTRKLPVFAPKVAVQEHAIAKAKTSGLTYTFVYNGLFLDWGLQKQFLFRWADRKPTIIDGGDAVFSSTSLPSIADAVVGILTHPEETKNRAVYIEDIKLTQNKLLELAKRAFPAEPWEPQPAKLDDITAKADARLAQGLLDAETFGPYILRAIYGPVNGASYSKTDNELLGLKGWTEDQVLELFKKTIQ